MNKNETVNSKKKKKNIKKNKCSSFFKRYFRKIGNQINEAKRRDYILKSSEK